MNHVQILKRSWNILWNYKTLWIFGVILALTTGGGSFQGNFGGRSSTPARDSDFNFNLPRDFGREMEDFGRFFQRGITPQVSQTLLWVVVALVALILLLAIVFAFLRYISQVALIRMVDENESSGVKHTWKQGFRLGWSRSAWRLFLINLVIRLPVAIVIIGLLGCATLPVLFSLMDGSRPSIPGIIAAVGLLFLVIFLAIIIELVLSWLLEPIYRACVLGVYGVFDSIRKGWELVRHNFMDVLVMWLFLIGVKIGFFFLTIPIVLVLIGIGALFGGGAGFSLYFLLQALQSSQLFLPAIIIGGLIFMVVVSLPMLFLSGLLETYLSTTWTLTYRELVVKPVLPAPIQPEESLSEDNTPQEPA